MKKLRYWIAGAAAAALVATGVAVLPSANADVAASPDAAFDAWNDAFLVRNSGGNTYYTDKLKSVSTAQSKWFVAALNIAVAEDAYQRIRSAGNRQLVMDLVTFMIKDNGRDWTPNSWNDDMAWMDLAVLRGYQSSGNPDWLTIAADNWNKTYDRGWSSPGGGGIWEDNNRQDRGKCSLSNNPMATAAILLYQYTGDRTYLTKAESIYAWVRKTLVDTSTGQVRGCIFFNDDGSVRGDNSDNVYDAGSWIEAANLLYRITGERGYYDDALRSADHIKNTVPIIHQNQGPGSSYQYRYFRGLSEFCTDNNLCGQYADYMRANADSAWANRNSANLMWNDWTKPTNSPDATAFEMNSAVGLWQQLPYTGGSALTGTFQIRNAASNQYLTVQGASTGNGAPIVQTPDANDPATLWTFTLRSNGHYEIVNAHSGQLLNVAASSAKPGAPVVQWPSQGTTRNANDQWQPIRNSDGSYSFYNRNSQFALDNPGGSTTAGTAYGQWAPNDGAPQRFALISR